MAVAERRKKPPPVPTQGQAAVSARGGRAAQA